MKILKETFRIDSILLTTIGGAIIGCLVQCADYHTIAHGPSRAFLVAGLAGAMAGLVAGCLGRALGAALCLRKQNTGIPRWLGNVLAFIAAAAVVPVFALA